MLTKKEVIKSLQNLPSEFEAEEAIERIILLEKIRLGIEDSKQGKVLSREEARKRLSKWLK